MEALEGLLTALKKREYNKSFEEANALLQEVTKLKESVIAFEKESLIKIVPATFAKTQQFVTSAKNDLKKLDGDISGFIKKTLDDKFSAVKSPLAQATQFHFHNRFPEASEAVEKSRAGLIALDQPPFNLSETVIVFINDMRAQIDTLEKKIADTMIGRVVDEKIRVAKSHGSTGTNMLSHYRYDEALAGIAKAREAIAELQEAPYNTMESVVKFLPDFVKLMDETEQKVGEAMLGKIVTEKIRVTKSHATQAKDMHFHNRYEESLTAIAKAREAIAELQEAPYNTLESVIKALPEIVQLVDVTEQKVGESMFGKVVTEKIRVAKSHFSTATDMHNHYRYDESLAAIAKARENIAELEEAPYNTFEAVIKFLAETKPALDTLEGKVGESMFGKIVTEKIRVANSHYTTAKDMNYHHRNEEALEGVAKARESISELQEAPYNTLESVVKFLPDYIKQVDAIEKTIGEAMFGKIVTEKIRVAKSHFSTATDMHNHYRNEEAIEAVAKTREAFTELDEAPYNTFDSVIQFLSETKPAVDALEGKIGEAMFGKIVTEKIRVAKSHFTTAKDMHDHYRNEEALEAIAKARETAAELDETPYNTMESVIKFLSETRPAIEELEKKVGEAMFGKVVTEKIRVANSHYTTAKDMNYHHRNEEALEAIAKARESITELNDAPYNTFDSVIKFLSETKPAVDALEKTIGEAMFGKIVTEKIRVAKSHFTTAKDMHDHYRNEEALEAIAKTRETMTELDETPYNTMDSVVAFLSETKPAIEALEKKVGEAMFGKIVTEKIRIAKSHMTTATDMHSHYRNEEALEAIAKTRETMSELDETPYNTLDSVIAFLSETKPAVEDLEKKVGEAMFGKVVTEKIRVANSHLSTAKDMHDHYRNEEALEAIAKARETSAELDAAPYNTFDSVIKFLSEIKPAIEELEGKIGEAMFGKVVTEKIRVATSNMTTAKDMNYHSRNEEALEALAKTRESIAELEEAPYNTLQSTIAFLKETKPAVDELETKIGEAMFGKVVSEKMQTAKSNINQAVQMNEHNRFDEALTFLTKAFESIGELDSQPYNTLPVVKNFVQESKATVSSLEQKIGSKMGGATGVTTTAGSAATPASTSAASQPAPGFPNGPITATVGPWVVHPASNLSSMKAESNTNPKTRSFVLSWNTTILNISTAWKKVVNDLIRAAKVSEVVKVGQQYQPSVPYASDTDHVKDLLVKLEKQVNELPDDANDTVRAAMLEQLRVAKANWDENAARLVRVSEFIKALMKANSVHHSLKFNAESPREEGLLKHATEAKSTLFELNMKFPQLPPFQEPLEKLIKESEHRGRVHDILEIIEQAIRALVREPINNNTKNKEVLDILQQLEKWPVARRAAIRRLEKIYNSFFRFHPIDFTEEHKISWPTPTAKTDLWQPTEADMGIPDYELIRPGTPEQTGLPFTNKPDSTSDQIFKEYTLPHAGHIVFSAESIPPQIKNKDALKNKFTLNELVFARAVWPRSIANYPIGKKKDGSAAYTVGDMMDHDYLMPSLVLHTNLKINGKPVSGSKYAYQDSFGYFHGNKNMYEKQQTVGWDMVGVSSKSDSFGSGWDLMPRKLYGHLVHLGPGTHRIDISLHYNLYDGNPTHQKRRDEPYNLDTLTSHPLAEGSFEITVPAGAKIPDTFGASKVEAVPQKALTNYYKTRARLGPEHMLWCQEVGGWDIAIDEKEVVEWVHDKLVKHKIPAQYGRTYVCLAYKSPEDKWQQEVVTYSTLLVIGGTKPDWALGVDNVVSISEGSPFEVKFLPDEIIALIPNRCAEKFRNV